MCSSCENVAERQAETHNMKILISFQTALEISIAVETQRQIDRGTREEGMSKPNNFVRVIIKTILLCDQYLLVQLH